MVMTDVTVAMALVMVDVVNMANVMVMEVIVVMMKR